MPRRALLATLLVVGLATAVEATPPAGPVLVELFTSQGCSSCPPADTVLDELLARPDVLALAFHVTYWDRLGWPDTLGDARFDRRQRAYARQLASSTIYTPQAIVGGRADVVGSQAATMRRAIDLIREARPPALIGIADDGAVHLAAGVGGAGTVLWAAAWDPRQPVRIERGENAGSTITYHHAVRDLVELDDGAVLPLARWRAEGREGVAVVAQDRRTGDVLATGSFVIRGPGGDG